MIIRCECEVSVIKEKVWKFYFRCDDVCVFDKSVMIMDIISGIRVITPRISKYPKNKMLFDSDTIVENSSYFLSMNE